MNLELPKINQNPQRFSHKSSEIYTNLILLLPGDFKQWSALPQGETLHRRLTAQGQHLSETEPFVIDLPNRLGTRVALAAVGPKMDAFTLLTLARKLIAAHRPQAQVLAIAGYDLDAAVGERAYEALVAAAFAAAATMPDYRSKPDKKRALRELHLFGHTRADGYARTRAEALGNNLARYLTALPANELTPAVYRKRVQEIARGRGWKIDFFDQKKLQAAGAGAFLAVARGSPEPDAGILRIRYTPGRARKAAARHNDVGMALVGKGICFDTGGTNLKTAKGMYGMHEDMEGSAVALGSLLALSELKAPFPIECWLALAQNHIGPKAYKPNEVVTASNGVTIEVVHTDAEGRMVLADTLAFASKQKPRLIIDYATLTGACIHALGTGYSGGFTNRQELQAQIIAAGQASGERVWPFPIPEDYVQELKSDIADIKQCTLGGEADHILAALFLKKFLSGDPAWVHIDLAAGNHKGGLAHVATDVTGFGVRFTLNLLFDQKVME